MDTLADRAGGPLSESILDDPSDYRLTADVSDDGDAVTVAWLEPLDFHLALNPDAADLLTDTDQDGDTTVREGVNTAWVNILKQFIAPDLDLMEDQGALPPDDDDPYLTASVRFTFDPTTPEAAVVSAIWDRFASIMLNGTDPGTFDHPYFVGRLIRALREGTEG